MSGGYFCCTKKTTNTLPHMKKAITCDSHTNSVSKKFRSCIRCRIAATCQALSLPAETEAECDSLIDRYISDGIVPGENQAKEVLIIFSLLRPEIDRAISRSAAARVRAARRHANPRKTKNTAPDARALRLAEIMTSEDPTDEEIDEVMKELLPLNRSQRRLLAQKRRRDGRRQPRPYQK